MDENETGSGPDTPTEQQEYSLDDIVGMMPDIDAEETPSPSEAEAIAAEEQPEQTDVPVGDGTDLSQSDDESEAEESAEEESESVEPEEEPAEPEAKADENEPWTPAMQEAFDKRLGKEVAKRKALEERLEALESGDTPEKAAHHPQSGPLDQIEDTAELERQEQMAEDVLTHVEDQLETLIYEPDKVEGWLKNNGVELPDYDPETMRKHLSTLRKSARSVIREAPKRREALRETDAWHSQAKQRFKWLTDAESRESHTYQQLLTRYPNIRRLGNDWPVLVGVAVEGLKVIEARELAAKATSQGSKSVERRTPPKQPRASAPPARRKVDPHAEARKRFQQTGNVDDLAASLPDDI